MKNETLIRRTRLQNENQNKSKQQLTRLCIASHNRKIGKLYRPRSDAIYCGVWSGSTSFKLNIGNSRTLYNALSYSFYCLFEAIFVLNSTILRQSVAEAPHICGASATDCLNIVLFSTHTDEKYRQSNPVITQRCDNVSSTSLWRCIVFFLCLWCIIGIFPLGIKVY